MAGGANLDDDDIISGINVTPLVDIMLVLLIIFMLTANIINNPAIQVDLPKASTGEATEPTTIALTLTEDGSIYLNGELTTKPALIAYLPEVAKADEKAQALIAADKAVPHGKVIQLIDLVRQMGVYRFALNIDPNQAPIQMGVP
jgi:biopolymer transport protein TolR